MTTGNKLVDTVGQMNISGNVTPNHWYQLPLFRYASGKMNLLAIAILSDILYWYRPTEVRNEAGFTIGWRKKFAADKLQRSYGDLAARFGCSKYQATEACRFLSERGLIELELRTILQGGVPCNNVLFISIVSQAIQNVLTPPPVDCHTLPQSTAIGYPSGPGDPPPVDCQTYTETTTETSTEIKDSVQTPHATTAGEELPPETGEEEKSDTGVQMKAEEILKKKNEAISLVGHWKSRMAMLTGQFQKNLTIKEGAQLKQARKGIEFAGQDAGKVVDWTLENWITFAMQVHYDTGAEVAQKPNVGFFCKYWPTAMQLWLQSIAPPVLKCDPQPKPEPKPVSSNSAKKLDSPEDDIVKPSLEQYEKTMKELGLL